MSCSRSSTVYQDDNGSTDDVMWCDAADQVRSMKMIMMIMMIMMMM